MLRNRGVGRFTRCNNAVRIAYDLPRNSTFSVGVFPGIALMGHALRPPQADDAGFGRKLGRAFMVSAVVAAVAAPGSSEAAIVRPRPKPPPSTTTPPPDEPPPPPPVPFITDINSDISAGTAITDLGSNFLRRLGNQASGFNKALGTNPGGGGASESTEAPRYRSWGELYGVSARTSEVGDFFGDKRTTYGGVAGIGARLAPGVNAGISVDQSRTAIDVPLALQSATLNLTQIGFNASVDKGPWTWAIALVHGFGNIHTSRDTGLGFATAGYNARIDGVLTELSYYWSLEQSRVVPKAAFEYVRASTGSLQEFGGLDPVTASGAVAERSRILIGAEVGRYWIFDRKILDLSAYGKFVDNVSQSFSAVTVSLGTESITVQGIGESRYGADAGASASLSLTNTARLYVNYDGKFRAAAQSHQGTLGVELKW
jgi:uncharacterized protein with beta-barrel porin domain